MHVYAVVCMDGMEVNPLSKDIMPKYAEQRMSSQVQQGPTPSQRGQRQ